MKHAIFSIAISACLLLPSAGTVPAADPHTALNPTGQPGTFSPNGQSCSTSTTTPGNSANANGSPFNSNVTKTYAGNAGNPTGPGGNANNSSHAVSEYDVACFQQTIKQVP
jgi:hypothetical protein